MTAIAVRSWPILFSGEMVRAILAGQKTQTRRVVRNIPARTSDWIFGPERDGKWWPTTGDDYTGSGVRCPYGVVGDRLWVRESFAGPDHIGDGDQGVVGFGIQYKADGEFRAHGDCGCDGPCGGVLIVHPWKPSIHMPREFSRISLEITSIRVERLQEITPRDAIAEGIDEYGHELHTEIERDRQRNRTAVENYALLWDSLNASRGYSWEANPFVWRIAFRSPSLTCSTEDQKEKSCNQQSLKVRATI